MSFRGAFHIGSQSDHPHARFPAKEKLATGDADIDTLHGWCRQLVGERLQSLLDGSLSVSVVDGRFRTES